MSRTSVYLYTEKDILHAFMAQWFNQGIFIMVHGASMYPDFLKSKLDLDNEDIIKATYKDYIILKIKDLAEAEQLASLSSDANAPFLQIWIDGERMESSHGETNS